MSGTGSRSNTTALSIARADRATNGTTLEKISQLEQRVVSLERERSSQLYSKRHEFRKVFCSLEDTEIRMNQERKDEMKELTQQISRIKSNVRGFKKMLEDMRPGPTFIERLKEILEETEASILAFKDKQRQVYEGLLVEERQASQEVTAFQRRMEAWTTHTAEHTSTGQGAIAGAAERGRGREGEDKARPPAILALERFLQQTGGPRGGWDEYDHNTFQHLRTKHSNEGAFIEAALRELPTRTESEVKAHSAWYTEYSTLLEAKRLAIQQWKKSRQVVRSQQLRSAAVREGDSGPRKKEEEDEKEKREQERQLNKEKLHTWKVQQEQERQETDEARVQEEESKAKKLAHEMTRQAAVKERVRQYREERERERVTEAQQERQRRLAREKEQNLLANREIERFRERDKRAVAERKERERQKEVARIEQKMRLDKLKEQVVVRVERDPERLLRPTSGWREREKEREREEGEGRRRGTGGGVGVRELPRRAVPAWRQGL